MRKIQLVLEETEPGIFNGHLHAEGFGQDNESNERIVHFLNYFLSTLLSEERWKTGEISEVTMQ